MKQLRCSCTLFCAAMIFVLVSCGGNKEKTTEGTKSTDTTTASTTHAALPSSTVITTPQHMMITTHKVSNFAKWKASYDVHDSLRLANGVHSYVIGRGVTDSNTILVAVKADDMGKAKAMAKSASLKQAMQKGGVMGSPTFAFFTAVFQDTAKISSDIRSMASFTEKDCDTLKKVFDSSRHTTMNNGLMDRAYGYDPDDNHKVTLVLAVTDTAKAQAFWKSDLLKQARVQSGVIGTPKRFIFHVVQRY